MFGRRNRISNGEKKGYKLKVLSNLVSGSSINSITVSRISRKEPLFAKVQRPDPDSINEPWLFAVRSVLEYFL
jgi:hypothetical protein